MNKRKQKHSLHQMLKHIEHAEERRRRYEKRKALCEAKGIPMRKPGLYARSGGEEAAKEWFASLDVETQARVLAPSPTSTCRRGQRAVIRGFQAFLVCQRDGTKPPFMS